MSVQRPDLFHHLRDPSCIISHEMTTTPVFTSCNEGGIRAHLMDRICKEIFQIMRDRETFPDWYTDRGIDFVRAMDALHISEQVRDRIGPQTARNNNRLLSEDGCFNKDGLHIYEKNELNRNLERTDLCASCRQPSEMVISKAYYCYVKYQNPHHFLEHPEVEREFQIKKHSFSRLLRDVLEIIDFIEGCFLVSLVVSPYASLFSRILEPDFQAYVEGVLRRQFWVVRRIDILYQMAGLFSLFQRNSAVEMDFSVHNAFQLIDFWKNHIPQSCSPYLINGFLTFCFILYLSQFFNRRPLYQRVEGSLIELHKTVMEGIRKIQMKVYNIAFHRYIQNLTYMTLSAANYIFLLQRLMSLNQQSLWILDQINTISKIIISIESHLFLLSNMHMIAFGNIPPLENQGWNWVGMVQRNQFLRSQSPYLAAIYTLFRNVIDLKTRVLNNQPVVVLTGN